MEDNQLISYLIVELFTDRKVVARRGLVELTTGFGVLFYWVNRILSIFYVLASRYYLDV